MLTHLSFARSPDSQTVELDREFLDTITVQGREYQKYSIEHRTYFGPIDDVRRGNFLQAVSVTDILNRKKPNDLIVSNRSFRRFLTTG